MIGIVGTRDLSPYGREWCRKLVDALSTAATPPCIVSGLAYGADGVAHQSALDKGLCTVGVMATGIESVYPWQHEKLAAEMVARPGCGLITDYPMETSPTASNFLRRNRIIAGLCSAVLVVESKSRGGSLMTARYAVEYDRDVYALPGRVDDVRSAGCNSLIASNMARIITSPEELVGQLGLGARVRGAGGSWSSGHTEASFRQFLERTFGSAADGAAVITVGLAIRAHRGATADELSALTALPASAVQESIGLLEIHGIITTDLLRRCALAAPYA
jgi:DNA processing protein